MFKGLAAVQETPVRIPHFESAILAAWRRVMMKLMLMMAMMLLTVMVIRMVMTML